ncbi:MAG: APC family permease, partial [Gemmatimonadetes bacterium]|nr:APC family permease [Gemmatimonadota bacterium]
PLVAANVGSEFAFLGVWVAGGIVTLIGALCYAELASAHPHAGGEYHFLSRALGRPVAILFGWARGTVIQTGAIAAVAFVVGDYAMQVAPIGPHGAAIYAAAAIVALTALNVAGTRQSRTFQNAVTLLTLLAVLAVILAGLLAGGAPPPAPPVVETETAAIGMAMILVLLTFGGWSEAVYLSSELHDAPRNMSRVLLIGTAVLITVYLLVNTALQSLLGLAGLRASEAVAADLMRAATGEAAAAVLSAAIVAAALSTLNATVLTGARVYYAMARDLPILSRVGRWDDRGQTPTNGLLLQGAVALALVALATLARTAWLGGEISHPEIRGDAVMGAVMVTPDREVGD